MSNLGQALGNEDAAILLGDAVNQAYSKTYQHLCLRHDEAIGDDAIVFGVRAWRVGNHQVARHLNLVLPEAEVSWPQGSLLAQYRGKRFHFYRAGADGDSAESYQLNGTRTKTSIRMRNAQQTLFGVLPTEPGPSDLVFLHCGSPAAGFEALYIGAPTSLDGQDTSWIWLDCWWEAAGDGESRAPDAPPEDGPRPHGDGPRPNLDLSLRDDLADQARPGA